MSIVDLLNEENKTDMPYVYGVVIGIVSNNKDPAKLGRVKLKFPWRNCQDESDWARIAALMAGKDMGSFFLPDVGDEVLVAFEQGNIKHPYVIGMLWNGKDTPAENNSDGKNNIREIKSRSGHRIIFNDNSQQKKESIKIVTKAGHTILLDDSSGMEKIQIIDKTGSNSVNIDSVKKSVTIESAASLKIKSPMIDLEASGSINIKSNGMVTIKGSLVKVN